MTFAAALCICPASQSQTVTSSHPRVWMTPTRLARIRTSAANNTARWQRVKARADYAVANTSLGDEAHYYLPHLGLAYLATGDTRYSDAAIRIMLPIAVATNTLTRDHYFDYRSIIPNVCAGFDWCFDRLSAAQRSQIAGWLMDRCDGVWPETNPARASGWAIDMPANNYYYGFLMTWPACLAAYGHDPVTSGTTSSPNRPQYHLQLALNKYRNRVRPFTDGWGAGGIFPESTGYDSIQRIGLILDSHVTATGEDIINEAGFTYMRDSLLWRIHGSSPNVQFVYPLGDQARVSSGELSDYDRMRGYIPMAGVSDLAVRRYTRHWLDTMVPNASTWLYTSAWEFLFLDEAVTPLDYSTALNPWYFAPGPGMLVRRSNWTPDATYFGIWAGPLQESHQSKDVNGLKIWKGSFWLLGDANVWSHSGIEADTINHNNYNLGPYGQTWQEPQDGVPQAGHTLKAENTAEYSYFAGQAANSYNRGTTRIASDYVRKLAYVSPDHFLVYDRVTTTDASWAKQMHFQSERIATINGRGFTIANDTHRLHGFSLLPTSGVTLATQAMNLGSGAGASSYRLDVTTNRNQATDYLLYGLQVTPAATNSVAAPIVVASDQGNMEGARTGNWVVLFGRTEVVNTPVNYASDAAAVTQHLLVDLAASTRYPVSIRNSTTGTTTTVDYTSSAQGSLRFSVPAGAHTIGIGAGAAANNPPTLSALSPTSVTAGAAAFTLTVDGSGFVSGATVKWSGTAKTTTYVSATRLTASISASDIATAGTAQIVASNPGSGDSNALTFTINAAPSYSLSASPTTVNAGANIAVTWTAPPGSPAQDWIGFYKVGTQNNTYLWWSYTSGLASGTFNMTAPNSPGQYEFRYLLNNGYTDTARSNQVTVNAGYSLVASPASVSPGQNVTVTWTAPAGSSAVDWIALHRVNDDNRTYSWFQHTGGRVSGSFNVPAPSQAGQYQFRYFLNNGYVDAARSNNFTVAASYTVSASPSSVGAGGQVTVSYSAPAGAAVTDWIGLYKVGATSGQYLAYQYTGGKASGTMSFNMPTAAGEYEFRYFIENGFTEKARSNAVTVGSTGLTASPSTVARGGQVTVTWAAPTGASVRDWIALYKVGDPNTSFGAWIYTNGAATGTHTFTMPNVAGQYEFRYLLNNGYTDAMRSNTVTVN